METNYLTFSYPSSCNVLTCDNFQVFEVSIQIFSLERPIWLCNTFENHAMHFQVSVLIWVEEPDPLLVVFGKLTILLIKWLNVIKLQWSDSIT